MIIKANIDIKKKKLYTALLSISILIALQGIYSIIYTSSNGLGLWGINNQVSWAFGITNFVFWIGIAHSGTLISAVLFLFRQKWRSKFSRSAETLTLISVMIALIFPIIHTGRPWFAWYWLAPYSNEMMLTPNFHSPLVWDYVAIPSYFVLSLMFWYLGLIPDLAIISRIKQSKFIYFLSLGWKGAKSQWQAYHYTYLIMAGLATVLVISVHTIVSFDFSVTLVPGWHLTIFPPYFVAGAIFSGCAMVVLLTAFASLFIDFHTKIDFQPLNKLILTLSNLILYVYILEIFIVFYSGSMHDLRFIQSRFFGSQSGFYYPVLFLNVISPQFLWLKKVRSNAIITIFISMGIIVGMWMERLMIVLGSLKFDFLKNSDAAYFPTITEISIFAGTFGILLTLYLLFIKYIPFMSIVENHEHSMK